VEVEMEGLPRRVRTRPFLRKYVLPIAAIALAIVAAVSIPLIWSKTETDRIAFHREENLVTLAVSRLRASIAHNQESATVWDDAVRNVRKADMEWIDANLGAWMHTYFGHDGAFVLDPRDKPVFSSFDGAVIDNGAFENVGPAVLPLVAALRDKLRRSDTSEISDRVLSQGASDIAVFLGRPAIISVKPIVSDTGRIEQTPGEEYLHVAIRLLDGGVLKELAEGYLVEGLRFAWTDDAVGGEASFPLRTSRGDTLGYFIWRPYQPGSDVAHRLAPTLMGACAMIIAILGVLLVAVRRRSLKLMSSELTIRHLAFHDRLTGLPNRIHFEEVLDREVRRVKNGFSQLAVLYLDLDRFKQVNDSLGHPAGDQLIVQFANRLKLLTGSGDIVARVGGDEFTVIMPRPCSPDQLSNFCSRLIEAVRKPFDIDGSQVFIGVSVGVACAPEDGLDPIELTRKADIALYNAKSSGRSRYAIFKQGMDAAIQRRRTLEHDLREALRAGDQLEAYFQPICSAEDRTIIGAEALMRWIHPSSGFIAPDVFIPVAEETGLIEKLGELILRQACNAAVHWQMERIAVNVSAIELRNPGYAARVAATLLATGLQPRCLELEVTESAIVDNSGSVQENIAALRDLGVSIALDDFGTGFSSLARLQHLEVDRIKIDRSFIAGFGKAGSDEAIVKAVVDLARAIGLKTTAEGVETVEQERRLREIGCDDLQGYLLGKPMRRSDLEQRLQARPLAEARLA
jgi:diguanylate cyclase (GGDEF)-like protein